MNSKEILKLVSQEDIFLKYFGPFKLSGQKYCNHWRGDKHPNCYFKYRGNTLYFVDFGNDIRNINCFQACMYYYNCSYEQCLNYIDRDFKLNLNPYGTFSDLCIRTRTEIFSSPKDIIEIPVNYTFTYQPFQSWDIKFWKRFKFTKELVEKMKIQSAKYVFKNGELWKTSYDANPIFTYSDSKGEFKIYQPYANKFDKWRSIRSILEGYEDLPETGEILFITSSNKDRGVLKLINYYGIAPSSETSFQLLYEKLPELKKRFKYIYVFHNNDAVGKKASLKITQDHNLNYINLPNHLLEEENIKDPSDYVEEYSLESLDLIIKNKLKRDGII